METFKGHINKETETIINFIDGEDTIKLGKLQNEGYSVYDCSIVSGTTLDSGKVIETQAIMEVKTRNVNSTDYPDVALELSKVTSMSKKLCELKDKHPNMIINQLFLCKFLDKIFLWDISDVNLGKIQYKKCPKQTSTDGNNQYIYKPLVMFQYKDAIINKENKKRKQYGFKEKI